MREQEFYYGPCLGSDRYTLLLAKFYVRLFPYFISSIFVQMDIEVVTKAFSIAVCPFVVRREVSAFRVTTSGRSKLSKRIRVAFLETRVVLNYLISLHSSSRKVFVFLVDLFLKIQIYSAGPEFF